MNPAWDSWECCGIVFQEERKEFNLNKKLLFRLGVLPLFSERFNAGVVSAMQKKKIFGVVCYHREKIYTILKISKFCSIFFSFNVKR